MFGVWCLVFGVLFRAKLAKEQGRKGKIKNCLDQEFND
jgi:hypothetical protein